MAATAATLADAVRAGGDDGRFLATLAEYQGCDLAGMPLATYVARATEDVAEWLGTFPPTWRRYNSKRKVLTALRKARALGEPVTGVGDEQWDRLLGALQDEMREARASEQQSAPASAQPGADGGESDGESTHARVAHPQQAGEDEGASGVPTPSPATDDELALRAELAAVRAALRDAHARIAEQREAVATLLENLMTGNWGGLARVFRAFAG